MDDNRSLCGVDAFECLASKTALLSNRHMATFTELMHSVHQASAVYAWTIQALFVKADDALIAFMAATA